MVLAENFHARMAKMPDFHSHPFCCLKRAADAPPCTIPGGPCWALVNVTSAKAGDSLLEKGKVGQAQEIARLGSVGG